MRDGFRNVNGRNHAPPCSDREPVWTGVVTSAMGVPELPSTAVAGTVGDHATVTANFRDEYYGLIPAVGDHRRGPRLVTSAAPSISPAAAGENGR